MDILKILMLLFAMFSLTMGHSWVEALYRINLKGTLFGNRGYIRGYIPRSTKSFNDLKMQHLLPPVNRKCNQFVKSSDPVCKDTQKAGNYAQGFPPLVVSPGEYIALLYQENGHVTLPENSPQKNSSGEVFIYGTSLPFNDDTLLSIHKVWNEEGTGGDKRGKLLARRRFDDGRCYQVNGGSISKIRQKKYPNQVSDDIQGNDLWCQNDIRLPFDIKGYYTLYWVWDWASSPTDQFPDGQTEIYTSCMDVKVTSGIQRGKISYDNEQSVAWSGIKTQLLSLF